MVTFRKTNSIKKLATILPGQIEASDNVLAADAEAHPDEDLIILDIYTCDTPDTDEDEICDLMEEYINAILGGITNREVDDFDIDCDFEGTQCHIICNLIFEDI